MGKAKDYKLETIRECLDLINKEDADLQGFLKSLICSLKEILNSINTNHTPIYSMSDKIDNHEDKITYSDNCPTLNDKNHNSALIDDTIKSAFLPQTVTDQTE